MRKAALTLMVTLTLALLMALSATAAFAGWDWDECPPASSNGHLQQESPVWHDIQPDRVWIPMAQEENPGNKFK